MNPPPRLKLHVQALRELICRSSISRESPTTPPAPRTTRLPQFVRLFFAAKPSPPPALQLLSPPKTHPLPPITTAGSCKHRPSPSKASQSWVSSRFFRPALSRCAGTHPRHPQERHPSGFKMAAAPLSSSSPAPRYSLCRECLIRFVDAAACRSWNC
jgi:hypothetical protein